MSKTTKDMSLVEIEKLIPYVNNARTHSKEQITKLRSSLREFGFINPVIIDRDYNIIAGHGRVMAAKEENITEVPCVFVDHLTEAQKKAYIIADNRFALDAGWDEEMLKLEIEALQDMAFDLSLTGFDDAELSKLFETDDVISISPNEAQFLETRKFQIDEIARIFRVPPHMVGDLEKSSFSNIEQQSLEFVKYTLAPWIARWEQSISRLLLLGDEKTQYFAKLNVDGLLRGDYQSRMNGYATARQNGWMSANDIRELENLDRIPPEDGGDLYLINGNMTKLADAGIFAEKGNGKEETSNEGKQ